MLGRSVVYKLQVPTAVREGGRHQRLTTGGDAGGGREPARGCGFTYEADRSQGALES